MEDLSLVIKKEIEGLKDHLMLLRLEVDQVNRYWVIIEKAILESLPPVAKEDENLLPNILKNLLSGDMQCWVVAKNRTIYAMLVTTPQFEIGGTKNLLVYTLYGFDNLNMEIWEEGFLSLKKYAKSIGCKSIVAYSNVERILQVCRLLGGNIEYTFITLEV